MLKLRTVLVGLVALGLLTPARAADAKKPAPKPTAQGTLVDMTKDPNKPTGTVIVQVGGAKATFLVTERTRFEFDNGVKRWAANFLNEHVGKPVAVFVRPNSSPPEAGLVRILLPKPKPSTAKPSKPAPPKPSWVWGTVSERADGHVTIKLPNKTPPPPVVGTVVAVTLDDKTDLGTITVRHKGKDHKFTVNAGTAFIKLGVKHKHWKGSFLSIDKGETVEVFPRYGSPHLAATVDILLKGAKPKPAIHYKDTFVHFKLEPATKYEVARDGKHHPSSLSVLAVGEKAGVLPKAVHSHVAGTVRMQAPGTIHGKVENVAGSVVHVKVHHKGGKDKPPSDEIKTVSLSGSTKYELVEGKNHKPTTVADLKHGRHVDVLRTVAPPHAAELVRIHHRKPKPVTTTGTIVSAGGGTLTVQPKDGTAKQFTLDPKTKLEKQQDKKNHPATAADLKPGRKVVVVAAAEPPHKAHRVEVHVAKKKAPAKPVGKPVPPPKPLKVEKPKKPKKK